MSLDGGPLFSVWCLNVYVTSLASVLYGGWVRAEPICPGHKGAVAGCKSRPMGDGRRQRGKTPEVYTPGADVF